MSAPASDSPPRGPSPPSAPASGSPPRGSSPPVPARARRLPAHGPSFLLRTAALIAALATALAGSAALAQPSPDPPPAAPAPSHSASPGAAPSHSASPGAAPAAPAAADDEDEPSRPGGGGAPGAPSAGGAQAGEDRDLAARREEAKGYFDRGMALFRQDRWEEALALFLRSRAVFPGRASTRNAALCLYRLRRTDEALEMFEALLGFSDLPADYQQVARSAIAELSTQVGSLTIEGGEPGATIVVDGRYRGALPLPGPLRVKPGSREVRAFKEGLDAFGATVDVAAGKTVTVHLRSLAKGGTLQVNEQRGRVLDVVVDGDPVGKTPWRGAVSPGEHLVALRGTVKLDTMAEECAPLIEGGPPRRSALAGTVELGTQPVNVTIRAGRPTVLTLTAESLDAWLRVEPTPGGAAVAVDSVNVGYGVWEGRLRVGAHRIEVSAPGFLPVTQEVVLERRKPRSLAVALKRDPAERADSTLRKASIGASYGVGVLGLGIGAVTGLVALDMLGGVRSRCGGTRCPASEKDSLSTIRALASTSTVGLAAGAVGAAVGTILLIESRSARKGAPRGRGGSSGGGTFEWKLGVTPGLLRLEGSF